MVDYVEALKRPFSDLAKLLIYIVISIIPIVNFISSGYLLDVAQTSMRRKSKLPEFNDYTRLFIEGIKMIIIGFIYMIPALIIMVLAGVSIGFKITSLATFGVGMILAIITALIMAYISTGAILRYAEKRNIKEAFNCRAIGKKIFNSKFFVGWIIALVIAVVIDVVLGIIPLIGALLGAAIGGIFYMSVMGEIYAEA